MLSVSCYPTFSSPEAALLLVTSRIVTSGKVQFWQHAQRIRFVFLANQIVRLNFEHAQIDVKSVNGGLPVLDLPRGRDS